MRIPVIPAASFLFLASLSQLDAGTAAYGAAAGGAGGGSLGTGGSLGGWAWD
jgi:hypothetical protein